MAKFTGKFSGKTSKGKRAKRAKPAMKQVRKIVRKVLNGQRELKYFRTNDNTPNDVAIIAANGASTAVGVTDGYYSSAPFSWTLLTQGDGIAQRAGDEINVKSYHCYFRFYSKGVNAIAANNVFRVCLVKAKMVTPDADFSSNQVWEPDRTLQDLSGNDAFTNVSWITPYSRRDIDYLSTYKIVDTKYYYFKGETSSGATGHTFNLSLSHIPKVPEKMRFNVSGQIINKGYFVIVMANDGNSGGAATGAAIPEGVITYGSNSDWAFSLSTEVRYYDS